MLIRVIQDDVIRLCMYKLDILDVNLIGLKMVLK